MVIACSSPLYAQSPPLNPPQDSPAQNLQKLDNKSSGIGIRASKLLGLKIQNSQNESIGRIEDVVLDPSSARIQYVAVTYGGFLGLGDKLFAVPMQAIKIQQNPDNRDQIILVLDVTIDQMQGAKGFDEANWPNFSDADFSGELHRRYRIENNHDGRVDVNVGRDGVKVNIEGRKK